MHRLKDTLQAYQGVGAKTAMQWDEESSAALMQIPPGVRAMVISNTEDAAREKGHDTVTHKFFQDLAAEYGMDDEVVERFRSGG